MRHISERIRKVPTSQQLSIHYSPYQRTNNPQDLITPPGMDYRNNKRSPSYNLPRKTKVKRIRLFYEQPMPPEDEEDTEDFNMDID
jgi:hypothetical protein